MKSDFRLSHKSLARYVGVHTKYGIFVRPYYICDDCVGEHHKQFTLFNDTHSYVIRENKENDD